ncbi:hypothetical protein DT019_03025 [Streptomyces sp. SDr-06]|uniref:hypothetical protein n=1 Tax=Streptomyces sp. SDr-06 TaxID=2267702 RepID=UPI000DEA75E6|nr:hypothetical protein [Streptomyces sp. SDr-06]RCH70476.1 hypothetical protein DT019_03025 [Streptomyces sp. SDr-06]
MTDEWSGEAVRVRMAARKRAYVIRSHETEAAAFERAADKATDDGRAHLQKVAARYRRLADMARHHPDTYPDDLENWIP